MSDDLLRKMTSALADEHDGATAVPEATRSRVVRALAERKPRRRKWLSLAVPAFAIFGGSTAWAAATGNLPEVVERAVAVIMGQAQEVEEVAAVSAKPQKSRALAAPTPPVEEPSAPVLEEEEADEAHAEVEKLGAPSKEAALAPVVSAKTSPRLPTEALPSEDHSDLLTYRTAHRSHFQEGNCGAAVKGYRTYLQQQPGGTFALEAKYNLGVCLIRMGQSAEAKKLLQPFADGAYGDYRKTKSQELIDALGN